MEAISSSDTRVTLTERESTTLVTDSDDLDRLESLPELDVDRIDVTQARVTSNRYIGVVGLPSGTTVEIVPKVDSNLLYLLAYGRRLDEELMLGKDASYTAGNSFIEVIARLFVHELDQILKQGLYREYQTHNRTEEYVRGRLDVQRQLQKQGCAGTQFECEYDDLTTNTILNQVLLHATRRLRVLIDASDIRSDLHRYEGMLRQQVEVKPLASTALQTIELTRLNAYYKQGLALAELILEESFIDDLGAGTDQFRSLLVNTESLFENVVSQAIETALDGTNYSVETSRQGHLIQGDVHGKVLGLEPDFTVRSQETGSVVLVGDAKWKQKSGSPARSDLYQMATYQAKFEAPGLLVYPNVDDEISNDYSYNVDNTSEPQGPLKTICLPTTGSHFESYKQDIETTLRQALFDQIQSKNKSQHYGSPQKDSTS